jgi:aspartyl/asparaginyl beta-hydroxylase (cupin superfamily)
MTQVSSPGEGKIDRLLQSATLAQQQGRQAEALRMFEEIVALAPGDPRALNALGVHALATGAAKRAAELFRRATQADPRAATLWINLANAARALHDDEAERAALFSALSVDQAEFVALLRLAQLHQRRGEHADATMRWDMVLALAAQLPQRPADLDVMLAAGQDYVRQQRQGFASVLESGLMTHRSGLAGTARRRFDACVDHMLGRRRIFANACEGGVHYPFLPADEFFDRDLFPWFAELEAKTDAIRSEALALLDGGGRGFAPYVAQPAGTPPNKWTALDGSHDWSACYLWKYGVRDGALCEACPETAALIERLAPPHIPHRMPTVFFSLLKPHSRLPAHTGVTNTRAIVHLPLVVPPGCGFRVGGETREWRVGEAFAFDDTIEHEAWNDSDDPRLVLILDHWNPHLTADEQRMLVRLFETADASGHRPQHSGVV